MSYPVSAAVLSAEVGAWLAEDGWGYVSTFGGAEPGCAVGIRALALCADPATLANVRATADYLRGELEGIRERRPFLVDIQQKGLVMGLRFDAPDGGIRMSAALFQNGLWAMFASFDRSVLQFKPGGSWKHATAMPTAGRAASGRAIRSWPSRRYARIR